MKDNSFNFGLFKLETFGAYAVFINFDFYLLIKCGVAVHLDLTLTKKSVIRSSPLPILLGLSTMLFRMGLKSVSIKHPVCLSIQGLCKHMVVYVQS